MIKCKILLPAVQDSRVPKRLPKIPLKMPKVRDGFCNLSIGDVLLWMSNLQTYYTKGSWACRTVYIRAVRSQLLLCIMQLYIRFLPGWFGAEIKYTQHVVLLKQPINQFNLVQQRRQQALRAYCPNTVACRVCERKRMFVFSSCMHTRRSYKSGRISYLIEKMIDAA